MKPFTKHAAGWLLSAIPVLAQTASQGPFGFHRGMTREEVVQAVGTGAVDAASSNDLLKLSVAPKPYNGFAWYRLTISPAEGVLKIVAVGKDIQSNGFGTDIQEEFNRIYKGVQGVYGPPTKAFDF
jgi:hypothetical protein